MLITPMTVNPSVALIYTKSLNKQKNTHGVDYD
jgi:hypothetical protein